MLDHHDEQYIRANITIVEEQAKKGTIKNITAYLLKAFEDDYRSQETEFSKQQNLVLEQKLAEDKQKAIALAKEEALEKQFNQWKRQTVLTRVEELPSEEQEIMKKGFLEEIAKTDFHNELLKKKGFENQVIKGLRYNYLSKTLLSEEERNIVVFQNGLK